MTAAQTGAYPFPVQGAINALQGQRLSRLAEVLEGIAEPLQVLQSLLLRPDVVDNFELRPRQRVEQLVDVLGLPDHVARVGTTALKPADDQVYEALAAGPTFGDVQRAQGLDRIGHLDLLAFARAGTRYVTGATLAASRWLQRKAWVRRAAVSSPRPSGAMGGPDAGGDPAGVRAHPKGGKQ